MHPSSFSCLLWLLVTIAQAYAVKKPHILFIVMDDLGSHDLGIHGTGIRTPNANDMARSGIYLDSYYVLPACSPTRSAIMSGKYPLHTGIHNYITEKSTLGLPLKEETLAQVLKKAGYATHAVGKWHLGHSQWEQTPTFRGFDSFYGYYLGHQDYYTHRSEELYDMRYDKEPNCGSGCSQLMDERGNYSTHVYAREATRIIQEYGSFSSYSSLSVHDEDEDEPLFLYLAFQAVHFPDEVPSSYVKQYQQRQDWEKRRKIYAGMLTAADEAIGNVTQALQNADMWNDTLVIFTTDNGGPTETCSVQGSSNYPLRGGKCTIWEGGTRGDAFLSGPFLPRVVGQEAMGATVSSLFHCVDWLPTLAEVLGVKTRTDLDGVSQLQVLQGNATNHEERNELFVGYAAGMKGPAIRVGKWKLLEGGDGGPSNHDTNHGDTLKGRNTEKKEDAEYALFDLEEDPSEENDVAADFPEVVQELSSKMEAYKATLVPMPPDDPSCPYEPTIDPEFGNTCMPWCRKVVVYGSSSAS